MAQEGNSSTNSNTGIAFIVGILVVVVAGLAYFVLANGDAGGDDISITIEGAGGALEDAATAVEGAVNGN